jgi:hypothetical protein
MISVRKDLGMRVAGEKGQKADEFLTRSQPQPGRNIYFEYLPNHDIVIHANTGVGVAGQDLKMVSGIITIDWEPEYSKSHADYFLSLENPSANDYCFHYGDAVCADIVHNFGLSNKDAFLATLIRVETELIGVAQYPSLHSVPKIVGIDGNTVRIWATKIGTLDYSDWAANANSQFKNGGNFQSEAWDRTVKFRFTLCEKIPHEVEI